MKVGNEIEMFGEALHCWLGIHTPQHPQGHLGEFSRVQTKKDVWWFQPTSDTVGTKIRDDLLPSMGGSL